jgi:hypothetical protein
MIDPAELTLIIVNLAVGFGCAIPIARRLRVVNRKPRRFLRCFAFLVGIYLLECVALVMGMGIPLFSLGLAFLWGIVFGFWLRASSSTRNVLKTAFFLSLYSSLPVASFIILPILFWIGGWSILSAQEGARLGIPDFIPRPLNTILGFYVALALSTPVLKTLITTGEVGLFLHFAEEHKVVEKD